MPSRNNDSTKENDLKNQADYYDDLYQTIEFTEEDKRRLRQPNRQPLDEDYFAKSSMTEEAASEVQEVVEPSLEEEEQSIERSSKQVENEFRYKSMRERHVTTEKKKDPEPEPVKRRSKLFTDLFKPTYEEHYDLNELEDIQAYNQFDTEDEEKATSPEESKSILYSMRNLFSRDTTGTAENTYTELEDPVSETESHLELMDEETTEKTSLMTSIKGLFFGQDDDEEEIELYDDSPEIIIGEEADLSVEEVSDNELETEEIPLEDIELFEISEDESVESDEDVEPIVLEDTPTGSVAEEEQEDVEEEPAEEAIEELSQQISQNTTSFTQPILTDRAINESLPQDKGIIMATEDDLSTDEDNSKFVSGASWLTAGNIISRIIGALYVIPWATWLGESYTQATSLHSIGYKPYSLFLAIATAGFPSAIAKQMAYYHSMKEYKVADKLFKNSLIVMLGTGLLSAGLLFIMAPFLAANTTTTNVAGATLVIRSLTPALLILPIMSLLRGYFQGFNDMKPTAVSQIIEQFARVGYLLAATYAIMIIYNGEVTQAVVHTTFAAFIGALASLLYLVFIYVRKLPLINRLKEKSMNLVDIDFKESIKIMVVDSVPFILLGSGIIIAQLVDTFSFGQILERTSSLLLSEIDQMYGTLSLDVDKLVMIIISLAVAIASSLVPIVTRRFAERNVEGTSQLVEQIVTLFSFVMIPAALGMAAISNNIYFFFYPNGLSIGPNLLVTGSLSSIVLGAYTVFSTILQSMNYRRLAVRFLIIGLLIKGVLQYPMVALFHAHGALLSTMLGFLVASVLMWIKINRELEINYKSLNVKLIKIAVGAILMAISATMWNEALNLAFGEVGRFLTFVKILIVIIMAVLVYGSVMGITNMLSVVLGDNFKDLQDKMRLM